MRNKKIVPIVFSSMLVFSSFSSTVFADETQENSSGDYTSKDEVIYGNMGANGQLQDMYVVNTFRVTNPGEIVDYGEYTSVRNLSSLTDIVNDGNTVQFQAEDGEFYYQGNMENQTLPWDISITYLLDGEKVAPQNIAGKSGSLEIQISTSANEEIDAEFFENYLLQIGVTLDPAIFDDIQAPEGTKANAGQNKQITFSVMPDKEETYIISSEVKNFEIDPIEINAAPYSMAIESPDLGGMTEEMQELSDAISEIHSGVGDLENGVSELNQGAQELGNGSTEYRNGMEELNGSSGELVNGSAEIKNALQTINQTVQQSTGELDLSAMKQFPNHLRDIAGGIEQSAQALDELNQGYSEANQQLKKAIEAIPSYEISEGQLEELENSNANKEVVGQLVETYQAANAAKQTYNAVKEAFDGVSGALEQTSGATKGMASNLKTMASEIENAMASTGGLESIAQMQEGFSTLSNQYESFHNGLVSYTDGVGQLTSTYQELDSGIQELGNGTSATLNGVSDLHDGTNELQDATSDLPGQIEKETVEMMEEYANTDYEPSSFVSDKNENVEVVQFVLKTEGIEIPEPETTEEPEEEEKGMWERFLDLFR
ncbi:methyl-accepting chemotaxis protein [Oceanobacillus manasiensis]|uniref:X-X-X-Leu-X-X-Gly heptad repeat-containing protein n=1 Tax=Oceanobacillus manasiensis TaxID=586413 RepID=UPI0005A5D5DC|nr:X-X-X-Leu-X-X-Gly heptad repeat-containing protein [Oceanobacillus manasiensis]